MSPKKKKKKKQQRKGARWLRLSSGSVLSLCGSARCVSSGCKQSRGVNESVRSQSRRAQGWIGSRCGHFSLPTTALYDPGEGELAIMHNRRVVVGEPRLRFKGAVHSKHTYTRMDAPQRGRYESERLCDSDFIRWLCFCNKTSQTWWWGVCPHIKVKVKVKVKVNFKVNRVCVSFQHLFQTTD